MSSFFLFKYLFIKNKNNSHCFETELDKIPAEGALIVPEYKIAIVRYAGQLEILSLVCTHLGCTVSFDKTKFACPCHGSKFDIKGKVLKGPAKHPLKKYKYVIKDNMLKVFV